jgi:hypothetical protein
VKANDSGTTPQSVVKRLLFSIVGEERYYANRASRDFHKAIEQPGDLLFIHQMGKVGSTALSKSLQATDYGRRSRIYQTHFLTSEGTAFVEKLESEGYGSWEQMPSRTKKFLTMSRLVGRELQEGVLQNKRVKVITLVRDPVATNLSGFFFNSHWWPPELSEQARSRTGDYFGALRQCFLDSYPHEVPLTWFTMELQPLFGVDVFAQPFDIERGYQIYHSESADVLLLKLEGLSNHVAPAMDEFLGLPDFELIRANEGDDKWYGELYQEFKSKVPLPASYLDKMYQSSFTRQFYSSVEIDTLLAKWSKEVIS